MGEDFAVVLVGRLLIGRFEDGVVMYHWCVDEEDACNQISLGYSAHIRDQRLT